MPQGVQALLALLILLPGFVSARISRSISAPSSQSELDRVIEALIFSFFTYVIYILWFGDSLPVQWSATLGPDHVQHYSVHVLRFRVIFLSSVAIGLGFAWGTLQYRDIFLSSLRRLGMTDRTNSVSLWNGVFHDLEGTVQVGLDDGRTVVGWLRRYSDTGEERSLFLEKAAWVNEAGVRTEIEGAGILLTDKAGIEFVMFLEDEEYQPEPGVTQID